MEGKILAAMAEDLKIEKYTAESDNRYCSRVLYSALACWIKAVSLDKTIGSNENDGVSRRHIYNRCKPILNQMLLRYPSSKSWFEVSSQTDDPISLLRSRLIRHGDLLNVGFHTNLILSKEAIQPLSSSLASFIGSLIVSAKAYSGIAVIGSYESDYKHLDIQSSTTWLESYANDAWWEQCERLDEGIQYYHASRKSKNNYSIWQSTQPEKNAGVILARRSININAYEYFLLKIGETTKVHRIDPFLCEIGEHRRIMFALRSAARNNAPCKATLFQDHVHIQLWSFLPQKELLLLETYAWPYNTIEDKLEWDMPLQIWTCIKPTLEALGLEITEASYG